MQKFKRKKVYCIPVSLDQKNSSGVNELLADGAKIVTTPRQLIEDLYGKNFYKSTSGKKDKNEEKNQKENKVILGNDNTVVTDFSKISRLLEQEMTSEEIAKKINKDISEVNSMPTIMEIEGTIEQVPGNYYVRAGEKN